MNKDGKGNNNNNKENPNISKINNNIQTNNIISQNNITKTENKFQGIPTTNLKTNPKNIIELTQLKTNNNNNYNNNIKKTKNLNKNLSTNIQENFSPGYNLVDDSNQKQLSCKTTREDSDNLAFLQKKYLEEKEQNLKIEAEKRVLAFQEEANKKITKKLIEFTETNIRRRLRILDFMICFFVLSDISLSVYTNMRFTSDEYDLNNRILKERFYTDSQIEDLRLCILGVIFIMEVLILIKYYLRLKILRSNLFASDKDSIFSTGLYKKMLLEMLVLMVFTPPSVNGYFSGNMLFGYYTYSSDSFILLLKMTKLYYLLIIYSHLSPWTSERAKEIAKENKASIGANFALKATLKRTPMLSICILLSVSLILLSFMLRIFEYGFSQDANDKIIASAKAIENAAFDSYTDVFWVVIITMMTVGYGDLFPKTHMGRMIAFLSSIIGMIIQSLLIVRLSDLVELTGDEKKAFNEIKRVDDVTNLQLYSKNLIKSIFKLMQIKYDKKLSRKEK